MSGGERIKTAKRATLQKNFQKKCFHALSSFLKLLIQVAKTFYQDKLMRNFSGDHMTFFINAVVDVLAENELKGSNIIKRQAQHFGD